MLAGLKVIVVSGSVRVQDIARIQPGTPLLVIYAMGQLTENKDIQNRWLLLSHRLRFLGHAFHALVPCPPDRWQADLSKAWSSAVWDRGNRLPRRGGLLAIGSSENDERDANVTELLLDLLAPASLIESPLMRAARMLLIDANVANEWDAWHHSDCWQSLECFGFKPGEAYDRRLNRRKGDAILFSRISDVMRAQHS